LTNAARLYCGALYCLFLRQRHGLRSQMVVEQHLVRAALLDLSEAFDVIITGY
jgi:hypothetical protein